MMISDAVAQAVAWMLIGAAVLIVLAMFAPLSWWEKLRGRRMPVDDMVDVVAEHRPDCACEPCWDRYCERLVDGFDWDAAEDDLLRRKS